MDKDVYLRITFLTYMWTCEYLHFIFVVEFTFPWKRISPFKISEILQKHQVPYTFKIYKF
jgi:hypothetical protein